MNEHLIELLLLVSTLRHASAKRVTVICPYFGYMRSAGIPTPQLARKVKRMLSRRDTRSRTVSNRVESEEKHMVHANTTTSNLAAADVAKVFNACSREIVGQLNPVVRLLLEWIMFAIVVSYNGGKAASEGSDLMGLTVWAL